jgi:hypothetical protein
LFSNIRSKFSKLQKLASISPEDEGLALARVLVWNGRLFWVEFKFKARARFVR